LLKLRNAVGQLRKQKQDSDRLQAENQKLAQDLTAPKTNARSAAQFVLKEGLFNAGQAVPKPLWSRFSGHAEANFDALRGCFSA